MKRRKKLKQGNLLTKREIKKLIDAAKNIKDRALVSVLIDTGLRVRELLRLRMKDVKFTRGGAIITLPMTYPKYTKRWAIEKHVCKRNERKIKLRKSAPCLKKYIEQHPFNNDPNALLWNNGDKNKALTYKDVKRLIKYLVRKVCTKKKVVPHNFRYMRALYLLKKKNVG